MKETEVIADSVRHVLQKDGRIVDITSFIGCSSPRFMDAYAPQMAGANYAQFIVNTTSDQATLDLLAEYQPRLSEIFPNAYVKFKRLDKRVDAYADYQNKLLEYRQATGL